MERDVFSHLSYRIFAGRHHAHAIAAYNSLYRCWHGIWSQTYKELEEKAHLHSDDFDRLDEVTGIFYKDEAIGVFCYNWYDLTVESHLNHSYFNAYPAAALDAIKETGARTIMTMGNLGVHPAWRKQEGGFISEALLGLGCARFLDSDADLLIAYTRNDRKVNELCYRHGAKCIVSNHRQHNVAVDIIAIDPGSAVVSKDPKAKEFIHSLWQGRSVEGHQLNLPKEERLAA